MLPWIGSAALAGAAETSPPAAAPEAPPDGPRRAWLGVFLEDAPDGGVHLVAVAPGGPAEKAGLRAGDIVLRIGDRAIPDRASAEVALRTIHEGERVAVRIVRNGELEERVVEPGSRPTPPAPWTQATVERWLLLAQGAEGLLGVEWVAIPEPLRTAWGAPSAAGVLIAKVEPDGPAARAGARVGDIVVRMNGTELVDPDDSPPIRRGGPVRWLVVRRGVADPLELTLTLAPVTSEPATAPAPPTAGRDPMERLQQENQRLREEVDRLKRLLEQRGVRP